VTRAQWSTFMSRCRPRDFAVYLTVRFKEVVAGDSAGVTGERLGDYSSGIDRPMMPPRVKGHGLAIN
jgi:hypothetical protein